MVDLLLKAGRTVHTARTLGLDYISAEQSLEDTARILAEHGMIKPS